MSVIDNRAEVMADIIETYNHYAEGLDSKNWPLVRSCFSDEIYIDYGSLSEPTGSPDVPRRADDWMKVLQGAINGFDITRHIITNHRFSFSRESVTCRAYLLADHVIFSDPDAPVVGEQDVVTVVGEYTNTHERGPEGWKIRKSNLVVSYTTGNMALFSRAQERAAAMRGA